LKNSGGKWYTEDFKEREKVNLMETIISISALVLAMTIVIMAIVKKLRPSLAASKIDNDDKEVKPRG
jgi:hypothetical protein